MFKVTIDPHPGDPEFANAPYWSEVFDTQEKADAWIANVKQYGAKIIEVYEMSDSECYHFNMNCHSHGW